MEKVHGVVRTGGFTLVELVVVILLLAVLAAVMLPRFIDAGESAMAARLDAMAGSMRTAADLIHAQAQLENKTVGFDAVVTEGATIRLHSGYPRAHWMRAMRYLVRLDDVVWSPAGQICDRPWCGRGFQTSVPGAPAVSGRGGKIWPEGYTWADQCSVYYINNEDGSAPLIGVLDADC